MHGQLPVEPGLRLRVRERRGTRKPHGLGNTVQSGAAGAKACIKAQQRQNEVGDFDCATLAPPPADREVGGLPTPPLLVNPSGDTVVIWVTKDARRWPAARRLHFLTHPHLVSVLRAGARVPPSQGSIVTTRA